MKEQLQSVGSFCAVILLVGFIYWSYHHETPTQHNNAVLTSTQPLQNADVKYADEYKSSFIAACNQASNYLYQNVCSCTANKMVSTYTASQLLDISNRYTSSGVLPNELLQAYNVCVG